MSDADRIAIIGSGFSGSMLAVRLADQGVASVRIDASDALGPAYCTTFEGHLLNVRSGRMSAVEGCADDFVRWLEASRPNHGDPDGFAPRMHYGAYVRARLDAAARAWPELIHRVHARAATIEPDGVRTTDGVLVRARAVVLATGNPAPKTAEGGSGAVIPDPWAEGALERIGAEDDVIIVGTGLTMVDVILSLDGAGWRGRALALSRRGLLPRAHALRPDTAVAPTPDMLEGPLSRRLRAARALGEARGWRGMMEGMRPITAALWQAADTPTRARFVRHMRPWWDVHRHRIASSIDATLQRLVVAGRLDIQRGRVVTITAGDDTVRLDWTRRGVAQSPLSARWLIDCTGPGHDAASDPLTAPLVASGRARLDALQLGLDLDATGRVLDAEGRADPGLFVLGPPARAAFWETVAVPDIRKRIEDVVRALAVDVLAA